MSVLGATFEASEEEEDELLSLRSWIGGLGGEVCFETCVKIGGLFGSAPEVVADALGYILKEMRVVGGKRLVLVFIRFEDRAFRGN